LTKRRAGLLLAIVFVLALAAVVVYRWRTSGFAWREFLGSIRDMDPLWLSISLALMLVAYVIRAMRWLVMLRPLSREARLWDTLSATCVGFTAVVFFGRAGEAVRPYLIAKKANVPFSSQIAIWLVERILDLLMVVVVFAIALTQVSHSESIQSTPRIETILHAAGYLGAFLGAVMIAILVGLERFRGNVHQRLLGALSFVPERILTRVESYLAEFEKGMDSMRTTSSVLLLVALSVLDWGVIAASFATLGRAFPATSQLSVNDMIILLGFVALGSVIQLPGIGGGMQIVTAIVLTEFYGLTLESASGFALILWAISFLSIVPIGSILAFHEGIKWRSLKNLKTVSANGQT
jgi:glycosyltransferase 2 family protein